MRSLSQFRFVAVLSRFCRTGDGWLALQIPPSLRGGLFVAPNHHPEPGFRALICRGFAGLLGKPTDIRQFSFAAPACDKSKQAFVAFVASLFSAMICRAFVALLSQIWTTPTGHGRFDGGRE
jgi:hypothetical protein